MTIHVFLSDSAVARDKLSSFIPVCILKVFTEGFVFIHYSLSKKHGEMGFSLLLI